LPPQKGPCDEAAIHAAAPEAGAAPGSAETGRWVLAATILGSSIAFIDSTVVNVALPTIQDELAPPRRMSSGWSKRTHSSWRR
jgi:hypothetical protein